MSARESVGTVGWLPGAAAAAAAAAAACLSPPDPHRPTPPAPRRREGLSVFGLSAEIHCDPQAAAGVEESLVPCWGDAADLADRWDAR